MIVTTCLVIAGAAAGFVGGFVFAAKMHATLE